MILWRDNLFLVDATIKALERKSTVPTGLVFCCQCQKRMVCDSARREIVDRVYRISRARYTVFRHE